MLVGLLRPSLGVIRWKGVDIHRGLREYQPLVGYVPEEPRLYSYLTAVEYLELVGGLRDIEPRVLARRITTTSRSSASTPTATCTCRPFRKACARRC